MLNRHALANERLYRTGTRHYMDLWLAAERIGDNHAYTREGRRARMIATILEPLRDTVADNELRRLEAALCLVTGGEAIEVLRDICRLDSHEVLAVTHWAADAILTTGLRQRHAHPLDQSSNAKAGHAPNPPAVPRKERSRSLADSTQASTRDSA